MITISTIRELREALSVYKREGKTIGFVPTMGYLHEGHLSLVQRAKGETDVVVMSIFVNPLQFGPNEDFSVYPRDLARDQELAQNEGVDYLFAPSVEEMYPRPMLTNVSVQNVTEALCGLSRPGHFDGVATVVTKLFNIVGADKAFFGQKDAQQVAVIEQMVYDLQMPVQIVPCPIYREVDGLAMSSRNVFMSEEERSQALILSKSLRHAEEVIANQQRDVAVLINEVRYLIQSQPLADIEYVEVKRYPDMSDIELLKTGDRILFALAVKFGRTRLIDNVILTVVD
ncbi:pantoate--beta-alanine ligase [Brevibacillus laterosporus]|uniref:Pantothenate synthetase n=1 Tax=Brevibacillus laterosporus TaxID=1465 RepID=A0A502IRD2_BRELA|nr:pantoate--beta-alanine ligase [Brevibacillus laterosporus]QDX93852.1 pantoate--beta-alanine ligase [Brevibacillus laterosporus]TPG67802.1 pantoate--beta-alanine ligase [Brevibacillus laterosporus]TPG89507.1 pantoate--beta-alanine ligase [Brevibacillus laterosporus]